MTTIYLQSLETRFPEIPWREPIPVIGSDTPKKHYACRICIARHGLLGSEIPNLPTDPAEIERHVQEEHVRE